MAHVFGDLLRQKFRCGRMPNSRANAVRARGNAVHILPGSCTKTTPGFSFTKNRKKQK